MISASEKQPARFVVGIDLGTTNSAVAYVDTRGRDHRVRIFPIPQFVAVGEIEARETLPSFHYSPATGEFAALRLPWQSEDSSHVVGVLARDHGAGVPGRLVVSAKSWLSHAGVDRTAPLLPWHGAADVEKHSPAEVSARYLGHIRAAWNQAWPEHPLEEQDLAVTIPASFDEVARELTVSAAQRAGFRRIVLLEEPQAAFYAWIHAQGPDWAGQLAPGQKILVCDVGGGTTDFTLIQVRPGKGGEVQFHRFAVGEHLILGGDNLDLALAHFVEGRLATKLDSRQWSVLVRRCQQAKEMLLGQNAPEAQTVSLPAAGARLIGGALKAEVTRQEITTLLLDGFLPQTGLEEKPARRGSGFQEFGLPYAPDPAITRYLAAFLTAHRASVEMPEGSAHDPARPDILLFNGGLFESVAMRERMVEVLSSWFQGAGGEAGWQPRVLQNERLDLAVAMGAAYYGLVRRGLGVRISGGLARSYYIGVELENATAAALCLVPAGLEEGQEVTVERTFQLLIRQPVEFPLFVSSARTTDQPGDLVPVDPLQLSALPPIRTVLQSGKKTAAAETVLVQMHARLTEIGTLEVWCAEKGASRRWKLQFDVRAATQTDVAAHGGAGESAGFLDEETVGRCAVRLEEVFARGTLAPERLMKVLEEEAGMTRLDWPPSLLRRLWETLLNLEPGRHLSTVHEARWLSLLGFTLRPGYGVALDDWRVVQTWQLFGRKVAHPSNEMCRAEWWILWRRIAGGLVAGQQRVLADPLLAALRTRERSDRASGSGRSKAGDFRFGAHETQEVLRLLGSLELLAVEVKLGLGDLLLQALRRKGPEVWGGVALWAVGRLGSRVPLYGPLNTVVPVETAEGWAEGLIDLPEGDGKGLALMQLTRRTGDRYRDVAERVRVRVVETMTLARAPAHSLKLVQEGGALDRTEQDKVFGESLPRGLRLV